MTHDVVTEIAMNSGLIYFIGIFVVVLIYVLKPSNRSTFDKAARVPLEKDEG